MCVYVYLYFSISKNAHLQERHEPIGQRSCASAVAASARFAGAEVLPLTSHSTAMPRAHDLGIWGLWRSLN